VRRLKHALVIHCHQPVGNFDPVFERLTRACYRPFLEAVRARPWLPLTGHYSGPLLTWWEKNDSSMIDLIGTMVAEGRMELLLGGFFEPVLASLSSEDRRGQIAMMRDYLRERFGASAEGLWLTERVWDGEITDDLIAEGVRYVLVDDRHFKVSGFEDAALHGYYLTESRGEPLAVFPIDEQLRYLIPFRPVEELIDRLRSIHARGGEVVIYGDDGEKMGGWPGTAGWVYRDGWLERFLDGIEAASEEFLEMVTGGSILREVKPSGLCYLPTASYTEMEGWALPADRLVVKAELEAVLGERAGRYRSFIRGGHWKNFLVKYPEVNLLHKKALRLSGILRRRTMVPTRVREELYAAQCNDAYWHGIFGGLYLPHLRGAVWERLARVEKYLRMGEGLALEALDIDVDGREEIWAHSYQFSAIVRPGAGARVSEYTRFSEEHNFANVIARRFEAYHHALPEGGNGGAPGDGSVSIHDLARELPPGARDALVFDRSPRGLFVDRFIECESVDAYRREAFPEHGAFSHGAHRVELREGGLVMERCEDVVVDDRKGHLAVSKDLAFSAEGGMTLEVSVSYRDMPPGLFYGSESSLFPPCLYRGGGGIAVDDGEPVPAASFPARAFEGARSVRFDDGPVRPSLLLSWTPAATLWIYPIFTLSQSESGFEKTLQGLTIFPHWRLSPEGGERLDVRIEWRFVEA
jgi:alpha-amylase